MNRRNLLKLFSLSSVFPFLRRFRGSERCDADRAERTLRRTKRLIYEDLVIRRPITVGVPGARIINCNFQMYGSVFESKPAISIEVDDVVITHCCFVHHNS